MYDIITLFYNMSAVQETQVNLGIETPRPIYFKKPRTITAQCGVCKMTWIETNIGDSMLYTEALSRLQSRAFCNCSSPSIKFSDS
jgi:hypothetical protein